MTRLRSRETPILRPRKRELEERFEEGCRRGEDGRGGEGIEKRIRVADSDIHLSRRDVDRLVEDQPDRRFPTARVRRAALVSHVIGRVRQKALRGQVAHGCGVPWNTQKSPIESVVDRAAAAGNRFLSSFLRIRFLRVSRSSLRVESFHARVRNFHGRLFSARLPLPSLLDPAWYSAAPVYRCRARDTTRKPYSHAAR